MNLRLIREPSQESSTLGALYLDDVWRCWTLEDELREVPGQPVSAWKVQDETAIPAGRYQLRMGWSDRLKRLTPRLIDVPGFSGILIHGGNRAPDTRGCILVGLMRASAMIQNSAPAKQLIEAALAAAEKAGEQSWITIENPPLWWAARSVA